MPWVRVDDHFDEHVKFAAVGPVGTGVWLAGLAYCNRNLTDGFVPHTIAEGIGGSWTVHIPADAEQEPSALRSMEQGDTVWTIDIGTGMHGERLTTGFVIDLLVMYGLWEPVPGGFHVHDYLEYQPSKAEVLAERERIRGRVVKHRNARRNEVSNNGGNAVTSHVTTDGVTPAPVPKPVPVPKRVTKGVHTLKPRWAADDRVDPT